MLKFFKLFELPPVYRYRRKWLRRAMIIISFPQATVQAICGVFAGASLWWNWDGTVDPNIQWQQSDGTVVPAPVFKN